MVAFGRAAELAMTKLPDEETRVRALRDKLEDGILTAIPGTSRNGAKEPRLPNTSNIAFAGVEAEGILMLLDQAGICASSGSACTTESGAGPAIGRVRAAGGAYRHGGDRGRQLSRFRRPSRLAHGRAAQARLAGNNAPC